MLPSHGVTYGVLLLSHAARLAPRRTIREWVDAARTHGSYLAAATDLTRLAQQMLDAELAVSGDRVTLAPSLAGIAGIADKPTMRNIARVLLMADPPPWLTIAVSSAGVAREYVPANDLRALGWLDPELDELLLGVRHDVSKERDNAWRKQLGDAAEEAVMSALRRNGSHPTHVARISDSFGYDIEIHSPVTSRLEVKACGLRTKGSFHLTRNEYDKCLLHGDEWKILQVVFANEAFVSRTIRQPHVLGIYELNAQRVAEAVPADTAEFTWTDSAIISIVADRWQPSTLVVDPAFEFPISI